MHEAELGSIVLHGLCGKATAGKPKLECMTPAGGARIAEIFDEGHKVSQGKPPITHPGPEEQQQFDGLLLGGLAALRSQENWNVGPFARHYHPVVTERLRQLSLPDRYPLLVWCWVANSVVDARLELGSVLMHARFLDASLREKGLELAGELFGLLLQRHAPGVRGFLQLVVHGKLEGAELLDLRIFATGAVDGPERAATDNLIVLLAVACIGAPAYRLHRPGLLRGRCLQQLHTERNGYFHGRGSAYGLRIQRAGVPVSGDEVTAFHGSATAAPAEVVGDEATFHTGGHVAGRLAPYLLHQVLVAFVPLPDLLRGNRQAFVRVVAGVPGLCSLGCLCFADQGSDRLVAARTCLVCAKGAVSVGIDREAIWQLKV